MKKVSKKLAAVLWFVHTPTVAEKRKLTEKRKLDLVANTVAKIFLELLRATRQTRKHSSTLLLKKKKTSKHHAKKGFA